MRATAASSIQPTVRSAGHQPAPTACRERAAAPFPPAGTAPDPSSCHRPAPPALAAGLGKSGCAAGPGTTTERTTARTHPQPVITAAKGLTREPSPAPAPGHNRQAQHRPASPAKPTGTDPLSNSCTRTPPARPKTSTNATEPNPCRVPPRQVGELSGERRAPVGRGGVLVVAVYRSWRCNWPGQPGRGAPGSTRWPGLAPAVEVSREAVRDKDCDYPAASKARPTSVTAGPGLNRPVVPLPAEVGRANQA